MRDPFGYRPEEPIGFRPTTSQESLDEYEEMNLFPVAWLYLLAAGGTSELLAARMQMAFTLGYHILFASLGVGLPVLLLFAEWRWLRTNDPVWKTLARRWSKSFAVLFAVGAVSGTVLSFELGLLWPKFIGTYGAVIGLPFTLEAFAFFLEAIFLGIYVYTWDRLPPQIHWLSGLPVAISGFFSAFFVVTANAWMNVPQGFQMRAGRVVEADPFVAMFNPATAAQTTHLILAAYIVTGFAVAAYYAAARLRGHDSLYHRRAMLLGLVMGASLSPIQAVVGHWSGAMVAQTQPVKLAAMEAQFEVERGAPLRIGGWPDEEQGVTRYTLEIPKMLSYLAYGDTDAEVLGLKAFDRTNWPPVAIVHFAFQVMVGIGTLFIFIALWSTWWWWRNGALPDSRLYLWALVFAGPLAALAMEAGWVVTEVGRQPWIVQGYMRTADAVTEAPGIWVSFSIVLAVYAVLTVGTIVVIRILASRPLPEEVHAA